MFDEKAVAQNIKNQADELHEIADALYSTNALRGRRIHQIARNLESLVSILNEPAGESA